MKCPSCQSDRVRRSRFHSEDGLWRSIFYTAYRCRNCGERFQHLTRGLLLGAVVTAVLASTFALGWLVGGLNGLPPPPVEITAAAPAPEVIERPAEKPPATLTGEIELAARAEGGDAKAQYQLGLAYFKGVGIERDPQLALKWIEKAAEQGYSEAQFALGAMHHGGRGALQSFPLAFKWFERAAQQNHAEAQYSLGLMYRTGQGVAIDKPKAYIWFNLAAAQGHERAREARDNVLSALTPEQVLAAQRAAQEWRPASNKK